MQESFATKHGGELISDTLEQFLNRGRIANESGRHLETTWWDIAESGLHIVWNPFNKVRRVLLLYGLHLILDFLHGNPSSAKSS